MSELSVSIQIQKPHMERSGDAHGIANEASMANGGHSRRPRSKFIFLKAQSPRRTFAAGRGQKPTGGAGVVGSAEADRLSRLQIEDNFKTCPTPLAPRPQGPKVRPQPATSARAVAPQFLFFSPTEFLPIKWGPSPMFG